MVGKLIFKYFFWSVFGRNLIGKLILKFFFCHFEFDILLLNIYIYIKITKQKKSTIVHAYYIKRVKNILKQAN